MLIQPTQKAARLISDVEAVGKGLKHWRFLSFCAIFILNKERKNADFKRVKNNGQIQRLFIRSRRFPSGLF